uniref:Uncharacterized protein n=1 Tax=Ganoderma calidophilum TaxID=2026244 RepID=A0A2S1WBK9_9APHY|nr:hypothetical protein [Ganoderma calidophilum]AWJ63976.1 hypothetical protein [Ganoderma calidophilum]
MIKIKLYLKKFFNYYFKIVKLQTGLTGLNLLFNFLIIILGLLTLFLRVNIFDVLSNYPNLLSVFLLSGISYSIFVGLNLLCRLTTVPLKGIPFFLKEININKKVLKFFIGYLIYNIGLIILSLLVLIRINTFYLDYYGDSFYGFMLYELTIVLFMYINYIYNNYNNYQYELDLSKVYNFTYFQLFMLLSLPFVILINSIFIDLPSYHIFGTVYCEPGDGTPSNTNDQINVNNQRSLLDNQNAENKNLQANKNIQESVDNTSTSNSNLNSQINKNHQISTGGSINVNHQSNNNVQVINYNTNLLAPLLETDIIK